MKNTYIPFVGRIIIFVMLLKNGRHKVDTLYDKRPLWKRDLTPYQIFKVNAKVAWRRFDTQTRGMGLMFVMSMVILVIIQVATAVIAYIPTLITMHRYDTALKTSCTDKSFYAWNYKACEDLGVRP